MGHRIVENEQTEREHSDRWFCSINVRFGSKADVCGAKEHVRLTPDNDRESGFSDKVMSALPPESGHVQRTSACPLWAKSGHDATLSRLTLADPLSPSRSLHLEAVGKFCIPFLAVHT